MARVSTYLIFKDDTEKAFQFYRSVFGGEFTGNVVRFKDAPANPEHPLAEADANRVMHMALAITGGHVLMGSDCWSPWRDKMVMGTNCNINLEVDSRAEADRLFQGLSKGGEIEMPMSDMFWGAYFGSFRDQFGVNWMINCENKK